MQDLLLEDVTYQTEETALGVWRRFVYPNGHLFEEFVSHRRAFGLPLIHYTRGRCPDTGRRIVARGVCAIGRLAVGIFAVGQASAGLIAIGQLGLGVLLGIGQGTTGMVAVGQFAVGVLFGLGQFVTGHMAIGQFAFGHHVLAQLGLGEHVWDVRGTSPVAREAFRWLVR